MSLKQTLKKILPALFRNAVIGARGKVNDFEAERIQSRRFHQWMSRGNSTDKARVETRLAFDVHRLEKGLSHVQFRYGFGHGVLVEISRRLQLLEKTDAVYLENPLYRQALSAIGEYKRRHEEANYDLTKIAELFLDHIWEAASEAQSGLAGSFILHAESKLKNKELPFSQLTSNRFSVREYSSETVAQDSLDRVYELAMKTPSVCNRQATRIHQITDPNLIAQALRIQGGFSGYAVPPVLLFVASDIRAFMNDGERNEPFVDGGLFAMSLLYALEAEGLAACPLNAMFSLKTDKATRKLLDIPDNELPVMYIAVGHFPDEVPVCRSARKTVDEILTLE